VVTGAVTVGLPVVVSRGAVVGFAEEAPGVSVGLVAQGLLGRLLWLGAVVASDPLEQALNKTSDMARRTITNFLTENMHGLLKSYLFVFYFFLFEKSTVSLEKARRNLPAFFRFKEMDYS